MNITASLEDNASVDEIVNILKSYPYLNEKNKAAIGDFLPYLYKNYFEDYLKTVNYEFSKCTRKIQEEVNSANPDIMGFMEKNSGIAFPAKYKPVFYCLLSPFSAYNFSYRNERISTITSNTKEFRDLLRTPFHEYSHELFKTFTHKSQFIEITNSLKKDKGFEKMWLSGFDNYYDWVGWCEENLVNGFAAFLDYKYYGQSDSWQGNYYYDYKFFKYLVDTQFSPDKASLEQACISFYNQQTGD